MEQKNVISVDECKKTIGENAFSRLCRMGIIKYACKSTSSQKAYILIDSLPHKYRLMACL